MTVAMREMNAPDLLAGTLTIEMSDLVLVHHSTEIVPRAGTDLPSADLHLPDLAAAHIVLEADLLTAVAIGKTDILDHLSDAHLSLLAIL